MKKSLHYFQSKLIAEFMKNHLSHSSLMGYSLRKNFYKGKSKNYLFREMHTIASFSLNFFVALFLIAGCSSPEDEMYEAFKCGKVATMVNSRKDAEAALRKIEPLLGKSQLSPSFLTMQMSQRFQDDMNLEGYDLRGQINMLSKVYKSSTCQKLYH